MLLAASGYRSETVGNIIQCTKQSSMTENYPAQKVNCAKVGKMGVKIKRKNLQFSDPMNVFF